MAAETMPITVLIAEDEPAMLSLVARHVRSLGFSVLEASEGDVAWQMAQQHVPDLVILDVMMPGMSGWEVCKRIKAPDAEGTFASTGVIMLTGIGENLNEMTSALFAADTWLNKPFDFADLEARIHQTLGKYQKGHEDAAALPSPRKSSIAKKGTAKKAAAKKAAAKKAAAKKPAVKKATAKKAPAVKKAAAKKVPAAKKSVAKKAVGKQTVGKQTVAKKGAAKKSSAKKPARSK